MQCCAFRHCYEKCKMLTGWHLGHHDIFWGRVLILNGKADSVVVLYRGQASQNNAASTYFIIGLIQSQLPDVTVAATKYFHL